MTVCHFLFLAVWGAFLSSLIEPDRNWFLPLSQRGYIYRVPHDVTRKSCVKKVAEKGGKKCSLLTFPQTSPTPPLKPIKVKSSDPQPSALNHTCQYQGSHFWVCLSAVNENLRRWRFQMHFCLILGSAQSKRDGWISMSRRRHSCFAGF